MTATHSQQARPAPRGHRIAIAAIAAATVVSVGCGGGGSNSPRPLALHFDDYLIARVPVAQRQAVFKAQNDYHIAKGDYVNAQTQLEDNATRMQVARNELKQAMLDEDSAASQVKNAEKSGDMNRVNTAKGQTRAGEMRRRAADQKIVMLKTERKYLQVHLRYTEENMYAQEARFELAKAQVAQSKSIRPKGFKLESYRTQWNTRSRRAQRQKQLAAQQKSRVDREKKKYAGMKQEATRAAGGNSGSIGTSSTTGTTSGTPKTK